MNTTVMRGLDAAFWALQQEPDDLAKADWRVQEIDKELGEIAIRAFLDYRGPEFEAWWLSMPESLKSRLDPERRYVRTSLRVHGNDLDRVDLECTDTLEARTLLWYFRAPSERLRRVGRITLSSELENRLKPLLNRKEEIRREVTDLCLEIRAAARAARTLDELEEIWPDSAIPYAPQMKEWVLSTLAAKDGDLEDFEVETAIGRKVRKEVSAWRP